LDILKNKAASYPEILNNDDTVFLETCALKNLVSYPQFISLNLVFQIYENATQQKITVKECNPQPFAYIPSLNMKTYDFSQKQSFKLKIDKVDQEQAKLALRVFVDFLKTEVETKKDVDTGMLYEPLLTHLLNIKY
jgi:hypothetical protein